MASAVTTAIFAALLIMVVSAHEGHDHTPGMAMSPGPAATNMANILAPTAVMGVFLALIVAVLGPLTE
ncbi:hypothetical protein E1A91_A03G158100v1 [Gossypium mustelinum]|uniref:Uncharacterized protein n=5 Tax=Gossypium TaxID=3633 RepID=A0ABR0QHH6_GOSAR|nr:hypothetical protein ES319_A03G155500v1 [Gossypium barbadense]KAK5838655.1 hypothetical protein PVK06_007389 [Gossypium arboreum]TYH25526.1 hypothetical protein ES288_A03G175900v1 [Gossypium darwinii]TYI36863.1 hypothetical protein ES332_A03G171000v1 [Gossypium tomentosum]TYJ43511.1 hypothetical protein E1A91_A03G158100v1 [Gossypium mustelinum]